MLLDMKYYVSLYYYDLRRNEHNIFSAIIMIIFRHQYTKYLTKHNDIPT